MTCPRSGSKAVTEPETDFRSSESQSNATSTRLYCLLWKKEVVTDRIRISLFTNILSSVKLQSAAVLMAPSPPIPKSPTPVEGEG